MHLMKQSLALLIKFLVTSMIRNLLGVLYATIGLYTSRIINECSLQGRLAASEFLRLLEATFILRGKP